MPYCSIIVAAYNSASTIGSAINSLSKQTIIDIEVIVVNDASTDDTASVLQLLAYIDPRIRILNMERNCGPGAARNKALDHARGDWVAVLDADDSFDPQRLEYLLHIAESRGLDMISDNIMLKYDDHIESLIETIGDPFFLSSMGFISKNKGKHGQGRVLYGFMKPVIRRSFLIQHGISYPELRLAEDYFLALQCLINGAKWLVDRKCLYIYNVRSDSLSVSYDPKELEAISNADADLLLHPLVMGDHDLCKAISEHQLAARDAAIWTRFVMAVREKRISRVISIICSNANSFRVVLWGSWYALMRKTTRRLNMQS